MWADYICKTCNNNFEFKKEFGQSFPENPECIECGSLNTTRSYSNMVFKMPEGIAGNSKNNYTSLSNKRKSV